jgi:hypothetical protein
MRDASLRPNLAPQTARAGAVGNTASIFTSERRGSRRPGSPPPSGSLPLSGGMPCCKEEGGTRKIRWQTTGKIVTEKDIAGFELGWSYGLPSQIKSLRPRGSQKSEPAYIALPSVHPLGERAKPRGVICALPRKTPLLCPSSPMVRW